MSDNKKQGYEIIKVPYDMDGNKGFSYKVKLETDFGVMKFKLLATENEKLILFTIATLEERE